MSTTGPLIEAIEVRKRYQFRTGWVHRTMINAVDAVSLQAWEGKTIAVVGESGCGKSTLGRILLDLIRPDEGEVQFRARNIATLAFEEYREFRRSIQIVFQNPLLAFNPMLSIGATLLDAMRLRNDLPSHRARVAEAIRLLDQVGLPAQFLQRYPSQVSGGQLQRVGLARAMATRPRIVFLDEPTSALDVSIQRQIIELLLSLQERHGLGYVLVTHDFRVVSTMAHHVMVMYLGQIVEEGPTDRVFRRPLHPYTKSLLAASNFTIEGARRWRVHGEVLQLPANYDGCRLFRRCPFAQARCQEPQVLQIVESKHKVRCWRALEIEKKFE